MVEKLTISNSELQRFAYVASHDLQEPLRGIVMYAQKLEKGHRERLDQDANDDLDYINGQSMRWVVSVQRELAGQWLVEGAYVASRSYDLTTDFALNPVPRQYLSTSNVRDQATIDYLTANVTPSGAASGEDSQ
jgi:signal transduction histidine kinase